MGVLDTHYIGHSVGKLLSIPNHDTEFANKVFIDVRSMELGRELEKEIEFAIQSRSHFICILGGENDNNTLSSDVVCQEILFALKHGKTVIPFFQHDWKKPETFSETEIEDFINITGLVVDPVEKPEQMVIAYHDALMRLGLLLNISIL